MTNKIMTAASMLCGIMLLAGSPASAQTPSNEDVKLFRKDLRSLKKQIIASNIELTDEEAQQFWPIYDRYTAELTQIMDKKFELISDYLQNYDTLNDKEADEYIEGRAAVEESLLQLRLKYLPIFRKVLSGKTTALFFQLDWRIGLVTDLQLSSQVPTVEQ
jgi:Spy/CpxP family protein refolding chaperone